MAELALAISVFLASHLIPAIRPLRQRCIALLGERPYLILYSLISLAALVWVISAFADAPYVDVWSPPPALHGAALAAIAIAVFLVTTGLSSANPFSLGPGSRAFDPAKPGIVRLCKHPVLWGLLIWATSHLAVNGDLAAILLFGLLALLSASGPFLLDKKRKAARGDGAWQDLREQVGTVTIADALAQIGLWRLLVAAGLYLLLLYAHGPLIGVSPLAGLEI
ncbi:MAG: NnrU family protein [Rhodospirillales bacterium]|nr:NnrU family protein [Rhodospirillales bacterium]